MITPEELKRIEELCAAATPGLWELVADDDIDGYRLTSGVVDYEPELRFVEESDAEFIAESRTLIPQLVAEVRRLQQRVLSLEAEVHHVRTTEYIPERR